ncbi:hypothetical protein HYDPIDRAFT_107268 [Hydnomerulius pinastri MD-312]|nr:hypothetical protein HYDPIDRAFT_107268 [Hydnomerulius pinastri MD-312]
MPGLDVKLASPRSLIPQSNLIEIKTRSYKKDFNWTDIYPQLFLSQTAYLYVGFHDRGNFSPVEKIQLNSDAMKDHEEQAKAPCGS